MSHLKLLGVAVFMAALMACVGTASANPLTSPEGTPYTSTIKAESTSTSLVDAFTTVTCSSSTFEGKVESHSPASAEGKLASLNFSGCNYPVTVLKSGSLKVHGGESNAGTVTSSGAEFSIATTVGTCVFSTALTDIGTITDSNATKGNAVLDVNAAKIPRTSGNFLCGSNGALTASYKSTTPSTLYVDSSAATPSPLTSPEGTPYTSTIKAESTNFALHGPFTTVTCSSSTLEGKVESHSPASAEGKLASLNFSGCNFPVTVVASGSLKIHAVSGAVTSSGVKITITTSVGDCVYTTNSTTIGTITDSNATKGNAVLDVNAAKIPRTEGHFVCGASGTWTGSYKFTTPSTLFVD